MDRNDSDKVSWCTLNSTDKFKNTNWALLNALVEKGDSAYQVTPETYISINFVQFKLKIFFLNQGLAQWMKSFLKDDRAFNPQLQPSSNRGTE